MKQEFCPTDMEDHVRIDKYPAGTCPDLSHSYIQKLLKPGRVLANGQGIKANCIVVGDDGVEPEVPEAVEPEIGTEPMDLDILYEDQDLILTNKPRGMVVYPAAGHYSHILVSGLIYHCKDQLSGVNGVMQPGIAHRIDVDTAGVIIVCKNDMAHSSIITQLKECSITRRYQAIVHGVIAEDEGTVDAPIGRHPVERRKMSINYRNGKNAVAHYRVLNRLRQYIRVECRLEISRTHQIHVHMASVRHPLLGDTVHGPTRYPISGLCGQIFHAGILGFIHPRIGGYMEFSVPLPDYFEKLLRTLS